MVQITQNPLKQQKNKLYFLKECKVCPPPRTLNATPYRPNILLLPVPYIARLLKFPGEIKALMNNNTISFFVQLGGIT